VNKTDPLLVGLLAALLLVSMAPSATLGNGWEGSEDQRLFRSGDIVGVKRIIAESPALYSRVHPTALNEAVDRGQTDLVKYLASLGWLEQCKKEPTCGSPFPTAALNEDFDLMEFLMANGYPPSAYSLRMVAGSRKYKVVEFHLANGIRGDSLALSYAANAGDIRMVKILCASGSDPDVMLPLEGRNTTAALELAWKISNESMRDETRAKLQEILDYFKSGQCKKAEKKWAR